MCLLLIPTSPPKWKTICPRNILIIFPWRKWSNRSYVGISFQLLLLSFKYLTYKCMLILMDLRLFPILPEKRTKMCFLKFQVINQRYKPKYRWKSLQCPYATKNLHAAFQWRVWVSSLILKYQRPSKKGYFPFIFK